MKRISVNIRKDQYENLTSQGLNVCGLVRDLIDDYISEHKIVLTVTEETAKLYGMVISQTGSSDEDLEIPVRAALKELLRQKIQEMQKLEKSL